MVTRRGFECFSWSLGLRGSQRCCWTVCASVTEGTKPYAAVILPPERWACSLSPASPVMSFLLTSWKFQSFSPEVVIVPLCAAPCTGAAQDTLGSSWETGGEQHHFPQNFSSACSAEPFPCPAAPAAWDWGTKELLMLCCQCWASSGDWDREASLYSCCQPWSTREFLNASHFWAEYCCGRGREERKNDLYRF